MKFKTGDYAKIIANINGHHFELGTVVKLKAFTNDYLASADGESWWVVDDELELVEENIMLKKDLKEFDVVKLRNDDVLMIFRNDRSKEGLGTFNKEHWGCHYFLEDYNCDLTHKNDSELDIVAVDRFYGKYIYTHLSEFFDDERVIDKYVNCSYDWDWQRTEVKEMTVDEIEKALGYNVKIISND